MQCKKRLQHRCFPVNIAKFLRTTILKNICERLFLYVRILKKNFFAKWKNGKSKTQISEISEKLFRDFLVPSFQFCRTAKMKNSDLKILEKNSKISEIFEVSEFPNWPQFNIFYYLLYTMTQKQNTETVALSMENVKELFWEMFKEQLKKHYSKCSPVLPTH